ncbi:hypothetical protein [Micromonospora sp. 067-2]|uniref:hypothetical protein n=1 Tax=Micromonospora sp. 067-2 TaxID=2789270 RepID=UPI00397A29D2
MRRISAAGATTALLLSLLAGCTGSEPARTLPVHTPVDTAPAQPTASTGPTPSGPGTGTTARVLLKRSGGFAGRGDVVTVEPDGRWTAVDRAGGRRTGQLGPADLGRLGGLVADPRLTAEARRTAAPTSCADAFSYRLIVGTIESGYVDCPADSAPPPATRALVELLLRATG